MPKSTHSLMMLIGFIAGIPVFVEVGFVLLVPFVFVIARQAKISAIKVAVPLVTSLNSHIFSLDH